ncbi:ran GTPase-activating protein 1 [Tremella mesenterica]|uniref:Ran GTPase-activating protein 1 n=1 Tax=Tremella mesenterica TaxID=5217 RepID=A0A4Q1BLC2_TREME|nr:ran GTPase-activating protein 1 [Tremella mesenterica]
MSTSTSVSSSDNHRVWSILGKNLKADTADQLEPYFSQLVEMKDVEEVHLGGNSLGVGACEALAEVFKQKKGLKIVNLADIFTGRLITEIPQSLSALCSSLISHTSLIEINLSDNAFGGRCADSMVPFLSSNTHLQIFKLNNNGLGPQGGIIISSALLKNAEKCKSEGKPSNLKVIICGRNRLENGSASSWAKAFSAHGNLKEIRMPQNGIRMEGIKSLSEGLENNTKLEILDLQDNTITKIGMRSLIKVLPKWKELKELNLSDCLLGPSGGIALASLLAKGNNDKLEILKLQYGELDKRFVEILTEAIAQHLKKLKELELNGNWFEADDDCVEGLRKALALNGFEDALDELDDMEEPPSEEEDEDEDEDGKDEDDDEEPDDGVAPGVDGTASLPPADDKDTDV